MRKSRVLLAGVAVAAAAAATSAFTASNTDVHGQRRRLRLGDRHRCHDVTHINYVLDGTTDQARQPSCST